MEDEGLTRNDLMVELAALRRRVAELEAGASGPGEAGEPAAQICQSRTTERDQGGQRPSPIESPEILEDYRSVVQSASEAICITQDGLLKFANQAGTELTGYSQEELLSIPFASLVHPEDLEALARIYVMRLRGEYVPPGHRFRIITKAEAVRWVESWSASVNWEGRPAVLSFIRDVTAKVEEEERLRLAQEELDRRVKERTEDLQTINERLMREIREREQAEKAARESEARLAKAEELGHLGTWEWDINSGALVWSDESFRAFGHSPHDTTPTYSMFIHAVHPDDRGLVEAALRDALNGTRQYDIQFRIVLPNGEQRVLLSRGEVQKDEQGQPRRMIGMALDITASRKAEEALARSENSLRNLMDNSPMGIAVADVSGEVKYLNKKFIQTFGYTLQDIPTLDHWWRLAYPDQQDAEKIKSEWFQATRDAVDKGADPGPIEREVRCKDGTVRLIEFTRTVVDGLVIHSLHDVTESKRQEEALRESEQMFRLLSEQSLLSIAILQDGVYKYSNQAMSDLCEYSSEEIQGWGPEDFLAVVHPADRTLVLEQARMKQKGDVRQKVQYEFRIITKSGLTKLVEIYSKTVQYGGRPANLVTMLDITDRRKAEEAMRESEDRYRSLVETSPDPIIMYDFEGNLITVNQQAAIAYGVESPEQFLAEIRNVSQILDQESQGRAVETMKRTLSAGSSRQNEYTVVRKDGSTFPVEINSSMIRSGDGRPLAFLSMVRDLTSRKRAEAALRESEEHYRNFFDNALVGLFRSRLSDGLFLEINSTAAQQQGRPVEEIVGKVRSSDLYRNPDQRNELISILGERGEVHDFEADLTLHDGREVTFSLSVKAYPDNDYLEGAVIDITDRKKAEKALRENEAFLAGIWRTSPVGIAVARDRVFTWANQAWAKMHGYTDPREIVGLSTSVAYASDAEFERTGRTFYERLQTQEVAETEALCRRKDGSLFHGHMWLTRINSQNPDEGVIGAIIDITERKHAEDEERLYAERLEALVRLGQMIDQPLPDLAAFAMEEAVRLTRSSIGYVAFANEDETTLTMHAWSQEAMRQCSIENKPRVYSVVDTGLWGEAIRQRRPVVTNDYAAANPWKKGTPNGHVEVLRHMNVPIFDQGRIVVVAGVGNKQTDYDDNDVRQLTLLIEGMWGIVRRREADQRLKMLGAALEQAGESILITDPSGAILYANPAFTETTGYSLDEALGKTPALLRSGRHEEDFYKNMWSSIERGAVWRGRFTSKRKDGQLYEEAETISPIKDESGNIINFVMVGRDVTSEVLLEKQLFHAQKMEAIGTLAGGIAHDVNNLLQAVLGYSDLLLMKRGPLDPDRKKLEIIQHAARDGAELVSRILTFSRKAESKARPIDLNEEILKAEKLLRRTLPRMIEIDLLLAPDIGIVDADPAQIEQVILNLGVNAQHAMPNGGRLLLETRNVSVSDEYLRAHLEAKPGKYVLLTVSDTGIGIEPLVMDRIFEPFFTTKPSGQGTGLGLSMVHGIVKQHGGYIRCYSEPGRGTSFKIYFPASQSDLAFDPNQTRDMPAFGTETILLVDDDERIREIGTQMIELGGYKVLIAKSGEEALEIYATRREQIALVILDLIMPGMGGKRCLEEMLQIDPEARVLVASGYSSNGFSNGVGSSGARGFVSKPYDAKDILGAIRRVLDEGQL